MVLAESNLVQLVLETVFSAIKRLISAELCLNLMCLQPPPWKIDCEGQRVTAVCRRSLDYYMGSPVHVWN